MSFSSTISCLLSLLKTSSGRSLSKSWLNCAQLCAKLIFLAVAGGGLFQVALNTVLLPSDFFCPLKSWLTHQLSKFIAGQKPAGKNGFVENAICKEKGLPQWFLHHKKERLALGWKIWKSYFYLVTAFFSCPEAIPPFLWFVMVMQSNRLLHHFLWLSFHS